MRIYRFSLLTRKRELMYTRWTHYRYVIEQGVYVKSSVVDSKGFIRIRAVLSDYFCSGSVSGSSSGFVPNLSKKVKHLDKFIHGNHQDSE
jgi:hypothetical protein